MGIESQLSAEEMAKLSEKVSRWFIVPESMAIIHTLGGTVERVTLKASHSTYEVGHANEKRYTLSARINDTDLGEHHYV